MSLTAAACSLLAASIAAGQPSPRVDQDATRFLPRQPHAASDPDRRAIVTLMNGLPAHDTAVDSAETELQRSRAAASSLDPAERARAPERIAKAQARLNSARLERHRAYDKVIASTLDAYGLRPPVEDFRGHPEAAPGTTARLQPWHPRFAEAEIKNNDGSFRPRHEFEIDQKPYDGRTDAATGRMFIYRSGFVKDRTTLFRGTPAWNPDALASILFHETAHWVYVMKHAGGYGTDASVRLSSEQFALEHQADFVEKALNDKTAAATLRGAAATAAVRSDMARRQRITVDQARAYGWLHGVTGFGPDARTQGEIEAVPPISDQEFAAALERIRLEAAERAARFNHGGLQPAGPAPLPAPSPAPSSAHPPRFPAPIPVASEEVYHVARNACLGEWRAASSALPDYYRLSQSDLSDLDRRASGADCVSMLLRRLIAMRRSGEALDLVRLQAETQTIQNPPVYDEPVEKPDRRPGGCIKRGVWFPQC